MGWFLRKPKKRRMKAASHRRVAGRLGAVKLLLLAIGLGAALSGWWLARRALWDYAGQHMAHPLKVELGDAPDWMDQLVRQQLSSTIVSRLTRDRFDSYELDDTVATLEQNPWVERVHRLHRRRQSHVVLSATYRRPIAIVDCEDGFHRVDRHGVQLPGLFTRGRVKALGLPLVVGVRTQPRGAGRLWLGEDLAAALGLIEVLSGQSYFDQIEAVDVHDLDRRGQPRLVLRTRHGMVRWGLRPGRGEPIEPNTATKLRRLAQVYREWQSIDAGGKTVDIFGPAVFIRHHIDRDPRARVGGSRAR